MPVVLASFLVWAGCTTEHYRKSADKEVYGVIKQKTPLVKNMDERFTVEQTNQLSLDSLPVTNSVAEFLGRDGEAERGAHILSLENALEIAVKHNRAYQVRKEDLYLVALGLTLARHQFTPIFSGNGTAQFITSVDQISGATNNAVSDNLSHNVDVKGGINVSWLVRDVAASRPR